MSAQANELPDQGAVELATPDEYVKRDREAKDTQRREGGVRPGFTVYVPCRDWHKEHGRPSTEREERREVRLERDLKRVARGGTGYVWIGHKMVDPQELLRAIGEVQGLEADNRDVDRVGFEWWVEGGSGRDAFKLRAGYDGEVQLETTSSYGTSRDVYRIDDLLQALGTLGVLESDGPQTLAPASGPRPKPKIARATEDELVASYVLPGRVLAAALLAAMVLGFLVSELVL